MKSSILYLRILADVVWRDPDNLSTLGVSLLCTLPTSSTHLVFLSSLVGYRLALRNPPLLGPPSSSFHTIHFHLSTGTFAPLTTPKAMRLHYFQGYSKASKSGLTIYKPNLCSYSGLDLT